MIPHWHSDAAHIYFEWDWYVLDHHLYDFCNTSQLLATEESQQTVWRHTCLLLFSVIYKWWRKSNIPTLQHFNVFIFLFWRRRLFIPLLRKSKVHPTKQSSCECRSHWYPHSQLSSEAACEGFLKLLLCDLDNVSCCMYREWPRRRLRDCYISFIQ